MCNNNKGSQQYKEAVDNNNRNPELLETNLSETPSSLLLPICNSQIKI